MSLNQLVLLLFLNCTFSKRLLEVLIPTGHTCFPETCRFKGSDKRKLCDKFTDLLAVYNTAMENELNKTDKADLNSGCIVYHSEVSYNERKVPNKTCNYDIVMESYVRAVDPNKQQEFTCLDPNYSGPDSAKYSLKCRIKDEEAKRRVCGNFKIAWLLYTESKAYEPYYKEAERNEQQCYEIQNEERYDKIGMPERECTILDELNYYASWGESNPLLSGKYQALGNWANLSSKETALPNWFNMSKESYACFMFGFGTTGIFFMLM